MRYVLHLSHTFHTIINVASYRKSEDCVYLYPEPVYTGWCSVHSNVIGMPLADPVYTGIPLGVPANPCRVHWNTTGKLSWNCPTLGCHWRNFNFCSLYWNTTRETITAPHTQAHMVKQSSIHASLKWQDGGTAVIKWRGLCKFSSYLEFTALQWIPVLLLKREYFNIAMCMSLIWAPL